MGTQNSFDMGEPRQNNFSFPQSLADKYQPKISECVGIEEPKRILVGLLKRPKPCNLLFVGAPGLGKTLCGMSFAKQLPGALIHVGAQKVDVAAVDALWSRMAYMPGIENDGKIIPVSWWVPLLDEMGDCTDKAQLQLLSKMDGTAGLRPTWGGGFVRGEAPPVIFIFTTNGIGPDQTKPPLTLLPRFLSRCMVLPFLAPDQEEIGRYLQKVWKKEGGRAGLPVEYFRDLAAGVGVRDALMRLDTELLRNPTIKEVIAALKDKERRASEKKNAEASKWEAAAQIERDPEVVEAQANYDEAVRAGAPAGTIAAKLAWVTMKKNIARERAS